MIDVLKSFEILGVCPAVIRALDDMGFEEPTPIQSASIPILMEGKDLIGEAQTGTGKTAAFAIPLVQKVNPRSRRPQAIVLAPTRELALQVTDDVGRIGKYLNVKALALVGGHSIEQQIKGLRSGAPIVVGTPGRIMDHMRRGSLGLQEIKFFVLDEADEMLDMGFVEDIDQIMSFAPADRQTVCFSAVIPASIMRITKDHMKRPETVSVDRERPTASTIKQAYFEVREGDKIEALTRIIDYESISRCIIFCRTKRGSDNLAAVLQSRGYLAEAIHGDLNQAQRNRTMEKFKTGRIELLIATDVAARGLDVLDVTHVINFDIAHSPEYHVHRIGRTGRAGRQGTAFTFVTPREYWHFKLIERVSKVRIPKRQVPTPVDMEEKAFGVIGQQIVALLENGCGDSSSYKDLAQNLLGTYEAENLVATLIEGWVKEHPKLSYVCKIRDAQALPGDVLGKKGPRKRVLKEAPRTKGPTEGARKKRPKRKPQTAKGGY